jgi:chemotaxis signal transduction protein
MVTVTAADMELVLLIDEVLAVAVLPLAHVREPVGTTVALPDEYVQGVVERGAGLLVLLDLPTLLADQRLIIQQEVA